MQEMDFIPKVHLHLFSLTNSVGCEAHHHLDSLRTRLHIDSKGRPIHGRGHSDWGRPTGPHTWGTNLRSPGPKPTAGRVFFRVVFFCPSRSGSQVAGKNHNRGGALVGRSRLNEWRTTWKARKSENYDYDKLSPCAFAPIIEPSAGTCASTADLPRLWY